MIQVTDHPLTFRSNASKCNSEEEFVTLPRFVARNILRNKRRSVLTALSLAFSFLLLIFMISIWRSFYVEQWTANGALRLVCRHRVSLFLSLPSYYAEKIRALPGVVSVAGMNSFDGLYRTGQGKENFGQFGTDPRIFVDLYQDIELPPDQAEAWKQDRAGAIASVDLARKLDWKIGDRIISGRRALSRRHRVEPSGNLPFVHAQRATVFQLGLCGASACIAGNTRYS